MLENFTNPYSISLIVIPYFAKTDITPILLTVFTSTTVFPKYNISSNLTEQFSLILVNEIKQALITSDLFVLYS